MAAGSLGSFRGLHRTPRTGRCLRLPARCGVMAAELVFGRRPICNLLCLRALLTSVP